LGWQKNRESRRESLDLDATIRVAKVEEDGRKQNMEFDTVQKSERFGFSLVLIESTAQL